MTNIFKTLYIRTTGYSYTNLGRMFLRMFVGVMLIQFALRQIMHLDEMARMIPAFPGMGPEVTLVTAIVIEIACSFFIMVGFLTRLMVVPPFILMTLAEIHTLTSSSVPAYEMTWNQPCYIPMFFLGIYFFILLVGPGNISFDYFLSLHFIHQDDQDEEDELEEV